jgi:hypothetical protein
MYHKASISPLSSTQISKLLNGHSVRVSAGNGHDIELSKEQLKKFSKAHMKGKAITLTLDPYQMQNHQHLRGCGNLKRTSRTNAKRIISSATDRLIRSIEGSGIASDAYVRAHQKDSMKATNKYGPNFESEPQEDVNMFGFGIGGNITAVAKDSGKDVIVASGDRAVRAIEGSGVNRLKKASRWEGFANRTVRDGIDTAGKAARVYYDSTGPMAQMGFGIGGNITAVAKDSGKDVIVASGDRAVRAINGSGVNRMKKASRWEGFANRTVRDGIDTAGKAARVYYDSTGPMAQLGFGLKKRKVPKRKGSSGGALYPAGIP